MIIHIAQLISRVIWLQGAAENAQGNVAADVTANTNAHPQPEVVVQALSSLFYWLLLLVVVFIFGSYAILRASRRFSETLAGRSGKATDTTDIWSMHKAPEDYMLDSESDEGAPGLDGENDSDEGEDWKKGSPDESE